jgi:signal transduction histidine kinase/ActR/RegA family two-component response regulator
MLVAASGEILAANPAAAKLLSLSAEQVRGALLTDFVTTPRKTLLEYLRACSGSRSMVLGSLTLRSEGGLERPFRCEGAVIKPWSEDSAALIFLRLKPKGSASTQFLLLNQKINELSKEVRERKRIQREREEVFAREQAARKEAEQAKKLALDVLEREAAARATAEEAVEIQRMTQEQLMRLVDASAVLLSSLQVEAILPTIVGIANRVVAADGYAVWRFKPQDRIWQLMAASGLSGEYTQETGTILAETVPALTEPIAAEDVTKEPRLQLRQEAYLSEGIKSLLVVPLNITGENVGTIGFYYKTPHRFDETAVRVAQALANLAAAAIGSAELYEEQARLREQAEAASRAKDEFLAVVSHELRTPLNAIIGWSGLLRTGRVDEELAARAMETIERNARSQARLIEDLLDISRIVSGRLRLNIQPVNLAPVIEAAVEVVRPAANAKEIGLHVVADSGAGPVAGDPERLQQIIWNLLSNAVKFTPRQGRVQVHLRRRNSQVEVTVSDNGQGISPEFLPHAFERFRQADAGFTRAHGGLGLGLAIVRHLVELHGGTVAASSRGVGEGATFTVMFPLMIVHATASTQMNQMQGRDRSLSLSPVLDSPQSLLGMRLLTVEDEPDARELLKLMLERCGAEVRAAQSVREALREIEEWKPDLMISDIEMPGEDGYYLIQRVRSFAQAQGRLPAIALTAHARVEDRLRALRAGFDAHVAKPVEMNELITVIESLARRTGKPDKGQSPPHLS